MYDFVSSPPTQQKTKTRRRGHLALDQATLTQLVCIIYAKSFREHVTLVNAVGIHYLMQLFASIRTFVNKFVFHYPMQSFASIRTLFHAVIFHNLTRSFSSARTLINAVGLHHMMWSFAAWNLG